MRCKSWIETKSISLALFWCYTYFDILILWYVYISIISLFLSQFCRWLTFDFWLLTFDFWLLTFDCLFLQQFQIRVVDVNRTCKVTKVRGNDDNHDGDDGDDDDDDCPITASCLQLAHTHHWVQFGRSHISLFTSFLSPVVVCRLAAFWGSRLLLYAAIGMEQWGLGKESLRKFPQPWTR